MRTIVAGLRVVRRTPAALFPYSIAGAIAAALVAFGAFPAGGGGASAGAAFPLDLYFDLKQAMAFAPAWGWLVAVAAFGILIRSLVLAATLWLASGSAGPFALAWGAAARLAALAALALVPAAGLFYAGVAIRYAPFIWLAALAGVVPSALLARRAVRLEIGNRMVMGKGVPEVTGFVAYAYLIALAGACMSVLADTNRTLAALMLFSLGPIHALFVLGWRRHLEEGTFPGGGVAAATVTAVVLVLLLGNTVFDRNFRNPPPPGRPTAGGTLLILGGVDSTSSTGALANFDGRDLGFAPGKTKVLSYRGPGRSYSAEDTRRSIDRIAGAVSEQVEAAGSPTSLFGHSQAGVILDRMVALGLSLPDRAVVVSSSPPYAPDVDAPRPATKGPGRPGSDLARLLARGIELTGGLPFDIDADASPTKVRFTDTQSAGLPRLNVWALGDSVWLNGDWRRRGEVNVVALSDHVGATRSERTMEAARAFFSGEEVAADDKTWKGWLVTLLRHGLGPWKPE